MARPKIWNVGKLHAESEAGHAAADAGLIASKISTIKVDGKDIPSADAPLSNKIEAINAQLGTGEKTQDMSELIASNGVLAAKVEELEGKLTQSNSSNSALIQKNTELEGKLTISQSSVQTLNASTATNTNLLQASNKEVVRLTELAKDQKTNLAKRCLAAGCIDVKGEDGKSLAKDAADTDKLDAAMKLSFEDLDKAYAGAVNAAVAKTGVSFSIIPNAVPSGAADKKTEATGRDRFKSSAKVEGRQVTA